MKSNKNQISVFQNVQFLIQEIQQKQTISMLLNKPVFERIKGFNKSVEEQMDVQSLTCSRISDAGTKCASQYRETIQKREIDFDEQTQIKNQWQLSKQESLQFEIINLKSSVIESSCTRKLESKKQRGINKSHKQNESQNFVPTSTMSIKQIKKVNSGANCSEFLLCAQIPIKPASLGKQLTIYQLQQSGSNLDILLFKNKNTISKVQRFLTGSDYDHVAMIIKIQQKRYLLQSSGSHGVSVTDFSKFVTNLKAKINLQENQSYELAYRKFMHENYNAEQNTKIKDKSEQFVRKTLGKKYKFSPMYLFSKEYEKKQQTYFCSELLAQCLKYCDLVKLQKPSYSILPRDFNSKQPTSQDVDMQIIADKESNFSNHFLKGIYEHTKTISFTAKHLKNRTLL